MPLEVGDGRVDPRGRSRDCYERIVASILVNVLGKPRIAVGLRRRATGRSYEEAAVPPKGEC
jgi:hypothetical protein